MRRAGKHGSSTIRWFFQDATTFTIIFLIIILIIALDPLGNSIDNNLCESNDTNIHCNTGQLQSTPNSFAFTVTNKAGTDIILGSATVNEINGVTIDHKCHNQDKLIRRANTYPVACDDITLTENTINQVNMTYTYYESGQANADTTTGELAIFIKPTR